MSRILHIESTSNLHNYNSIQYLSQFKSPQIHSKIMASYETAGRPLGGPLPKFGEWDVNDPASSEGFTVIFNKARDDKKSGGTPLIVAAAPQNYGTGRQEHHKHKNLKKRNWFCCSC